MAGFNVITEGLDQEIHLDHGDRGGKRHEKRGPQSGGMTALTTFRSQDRPRDDRQEKSKGNRGPMKLCHHRKELYDSVSVELPVRKADLLPSSHSPDVRVRIWQQ